MLQAFYPIALFDSGVGGLTVAEAIRSQLPYESLLYLADTASRPFGTKSSQHLEAIIIKNLNLLLTYPIKMIVIACHTACSCDLSIFNELPIPVMTIFPDALNSLFDVTPINSLFILGTERTIQSKIYEKPIKTYFPHTSSYFIACSPLERLIEDESQDAQEINATLHQLFHSVNIHDLDAALLACTHFPIYTSFIQKILGTSCSLVDPAYYFSKQIKLTLKEKDLLNPSTSLPQDEYLITGDIEIFKRKFNRYFGKTLGKTATYFNYPYATL